MSVAHSFDPGKTSNNSASHQDPNYVQPKYCKTWWEKRHNWIGTGYLINLIMRSNEQDDVILPVDTGSSKHLLYYNQATFLINDDD